MPIQNTPTKLPPNPARKRGPGTLLTPAQTAGPARQVPAIGPNQQASRSVTRNPSEGTNSRTISRDELLVDQQANYGNV